MVDSTRISAFLSALILISLFATCAYADKTGVVFQISTASPLTWKVAVRNARNLQHVMLPRVVRIEIIAFGPGLKMLLKDSVVAHNLIALHNSGVTIEACKTDVYEQGLPPNDIAPFVRYIPSGIAEIVRREREGWAYVRP